MTGKKPSREAIAWTEIGRTAISRPLAVVLSVFFLATLFLVPLGQYAFDRLHGTIISFAPPSGGTSGRQQPVVARINQRNNAVLLGIHQLETTLEEQSLLRHVFLPPLQYMLLHFLGQGNDKAIPGRDGWLHFAPALEYLTGPPFLGPEQLRARAEAHERWEEPIQPDPLAAIVDFKGQLERRGIKLIVVPIPVKAAIQPEKISARRVPRPLANRSWPVFVQALRDHGVQLFDARSVLVRYAEQHGDAYLATDTHWLPGAMQAVAGELAAAVKTALPALQGSGDLQVQPQTVLGQGDIARMLTLPEKSSLFAGQEVEILQILTGQNEFWQPDRSAEILLLGDSFTNIYSTAGLGWGFGAGFAEQLSHILQVPIDLLARNDSGAYVTREMLAAELARGRDRLAGKKLVIWQFAERELAFGDWRRIALRLGEPKENGFFSAPSGESIRVTGVVAAISRSPRPGAVPYRDNILTMHLVDLHGEDRDLPANQALVYGWGMRDNRLTGLAALRPGDTVSLTLTGWEGVEGEFGSYRRAPLDDQTMELELPNWGIPSDDKMD
jgi:alginate O-acetyltransferase complex protein AlgJ